MQCCTVLALLCGEDGKANGKEGGVPRHICELHYMTILFSTLEAYRIDNFLASIGKLHWVYYTANFIGE